MERDKNERMCFKFGQSFSSLMSEATPEVKHEKAVLTVVEGITQADNEGQTI